MFRGVARLLKDEMMRPMGKGLFGQPGGMPAKSSPALDFFAVDGQCLVDVLADMAVPAPTRRPQLHRATSAKRGAHLTRKRRDFCPTNPLQKIVINLIK